MSGQTSDEWSKAYCVGYNNGLRRAAAIANNSKWHTDPRAVMSDIPKSIALQILEEVVEEK